MLKNILILAAFILAPMPFLTACGSSGDGAKTPTTSTGDGAKTPTPVITSISDRIASLSLVGKFSNIGTFDDSSDDTYDFTYRKTEDAFNLRVSENELFMTVDGVEYSLTLNFGSTNFYLGEGNVSLSFFGDDSLQVIDGSHPRIQGTYLFYNTDTTNYDSGAENFNLDYTFGYAVVGIKTLPSVVASQTATATYEGRIGFNTTPISRTLTNSDTPSRESYYGDVSMDVNFDAVTVGGVATLSRNRDDNRDQSVVVGRITFAPSPIVGSRFAGTFTLNSDLRTDAALTDNPVGNYAGSFFGPEADDIAGVMQLNGTNANGAVLGIGGFRGDRQ